MERKIKITLYFLLTLLSTLSFAAKNDFHILMQKDLPNQLGFFREIEFSTADNQHPLLYSVLLNNHYHAALYQQKSKTQFFADYMDEIAGQKDFIIGINGGFYHPDFTPTGLFLQEGKTIRSLSRSSFFNACLLINRQQKILLTTDLQQCKTARNALQAGPLLIQAGEKSHRLPILQKKSKAMEDFFRQHKRTVLASTDDDRLLIITTSPIALFDLVDFLQHHPDALGIKKIQFAMNLDGGSSTGMYIRFPDGPFYSRELKPVKTFVFIQ